MQQSGNLPLRLILFKDAAWWRVLNAIESDLDADPKALTFRLFSAQKGIQHLRLGPYDGE